MACCIAMAYLIALARQAWYRLRPGNAPQRAPFAPPARRPGPGTLARPVETEPAASFVPAGSR
jgi:hypothetical protein